MIATAPGEVISHSKNIINIRINKDSKRIGYAVLQRRDVSWKFIYLI